MDIKVNVWEEDILLPTYGIGKPEKNPPFFRKVITPTAYRYKPRIRRTTESLPVPPVY